MKSLHGQQGITVRKVKDRVFAVVCLSAVAVGIALLIVLLWSIWRDGAGRFNLQFLRDAPSRFPEKSGVYSALMGSLWVVILTGLIAVPVGVAAAIYLEEFSIRRNRMTAFIQLNIANLAGVPSIVYGLLGLALFVRWWALDRSVISGALTMSLLVLPMLITVSQEALRAVPRSFREASVALGATPWQTIRRQVLPSASSGIFTGIILALSRAMGETAPLMMIGAVSYVAFAPAKLSDSFTVLPMQIYNWASLPKKGFHDAAAAAIILLLAVLLLLNSTAIWLRHRAQKRQRA